MLNGSGSDAELVLLSDSANPLPADLTFLETEGSFTQASK